LTFEELGLSYELLDGLDAMGFTKATPIQEQAIPVIMDGGDLIACAQTGTGKTAAFLLPTIDAISTLTTKSIDTVILVPTRELAVQIDQQLVGFSYFTKISSISVYGGRDGKAFEQEKKALSSGANVVVATPGRLIAHLNMGYVKMDKLHSLILDEADRMLDMGFIEDLNKIISYMPKERQTLMFSATMAPKIRRFAKEILKNPEEISLSIAKPAANVTQAVYEVKDDAKPYLLKHLLTSRKEKNERVLIFSTTKAKVKKITQVLKSGGLNAGEIHSDLGQDQREQMIRDYKNGTIPILVATDILSRGIDVKDIKLVINNDVPGDAADYVHRVGRTARANADGMALTFVSWADRGKFKQIEDLIEQRVERIALPDFLADAVPASGDGDGRRGGRGGGNRGGGGHRGGGHGGGNRRSGGGNRNGGGGNRSSNSSNRR
jgi:ATP-dependent RNA helicase RhlE